MIMKSREGIKESGKQEELSGEGQEKKIKRNRRKIGWKDKTG